MKRWIVFIAALLVGLSECADRVLLKDVTAITLTEGARTNGRRSSPVPQLTCVGGSAQGKVQEPRIVQCKNVGFDGADVQWECKAELDSRVKFGRISVSCEGYSHPEDPYVLKGSCGLEYELEWKSASERSAGSKGSSSSVESSLTYLAIGFIVCVAIYMIYTGMNSNGANPDPPGFRRFGSGFDNGPGGPPGGGGGHPGYPGSGPPPKYDDCMGKGPSSSMGGARPASDGPGFWTGAGLGALGGYFMGRQQDQGGARYRGGGGFNQGFSGFSPSHHDDGPSSSGSSGNQPSRSTSTGYGGTTRR